MVVTDAWPSSSCTTRTSAPPSSRWVANECRSVCGETACGDAGALGGVLQHLPRALPRQPAAAGVEEDRRRAAAATRQVRAPPHQVGVQRLAPRAGRPGPAAACRPCRAAAPNGRGCRRRRRRARPLRRSARPVEYSSSSSARLRSVSGPSEGLSPPAPSSSASTSSTRQALGQPPAGRGRLDGARHVDVGDTLGGGELVQPAHGDQRARRRHRRQRRRAGVRIPAAQRHQELADIGLGDLGQVVDRRAASGVPDTGAGHAGRSSACWRPPRVRWSGDRDSPAAATPARAGKSS